MTSKKTARILLSLLSLALLSGCMIVPAHPHHSPYRDEVIIVRPAPHYAPPLSKHYHRDHWN